MRRLPAPFLTRTISASRRYRRRVPADLEPSWSSAICDLYRRAVAALPDPAPGQAAGLVRRGVRRMARAVPVVYLVLSRCHLPPLDRHPGPDPRRRQLSLSPISPPSCSVSALARSPKRARRVRALVEAGGVIAMLSYAFGAGVEIAYPGDLVPPQWLATRCWSRTRSNAGPRSRAGSSPSVSGTATAPAPDADRAVFPLSDPSDDHRRGRILLRPLGIGALGEFLILVAATVAGCWAFYLIGREVAVAAAVDRIAAAAPLPLAAMTTLKPWSLVIHGGAGAITRSQTQPETDSGVRAALNAALDSGSAILAAGGASLDAVEAAVRVLEDDPHFNAGRGSAFTFEGKNELDAAIMEGSTLRAGSIAGVTSTKNPVTLARAVMEQSAHVLLGREGADAFSREHGLDRPMPIGSRLPNWRRQLDELLSNGA